MNFIKEGQANFCPPFFILVLVLMIVLIILL